MEAKLPGRALVIKNDEECQKRGQSLEGTKAYRRPMETQGDGVRRRENGGRFFLGFGNLLCLVTVN